MIGFGCMVSHSSGRHFMDISFSIVAGADGLQAVQWWFILCVVGAALWWLLSR